MRIKLQFFLFISNDEAKRISVSQNRVLRRVFLLMGGEITGGWRELQDQIGGVCNMH